MQRLRYVLPVVLLALAPAAAPAQESSVDSSFEVGVRYWLSRGDFEKGHDASGANPIAGNPTSVLTYDKLGAHTLELFGRKDLGNGTFVKGVAGLGVIPHARNRDQ